MARNEKETGNDREAWMDREVRPLLQGRAMQEDPNKLSLSETADAWQMLDLLREAVEERLKALRAVLLSAAERDGNPTEKGGATLALNGARLERVKRTASEPDQKEMLSLLAQRKLEITDAYDEIKSLVFNASKATYLIDTGKLSAEEVNARKNVSFALRVFKADDWVGLYDESVNKKSKKKAIPQPRATQ